MANLVPYNPEKAIAYTNQLGKKYDLPDVAIRLLQFVILPRALRPPKVQICSQIGITVGVYNYWTTNEKFNAARVQMIKQYYFDDVSDVLMAMKHEAISGNERAARLFLEFVADTKAEADKQLPFVPPNAIPSTEVKIIINNLTQKFYGDSQPRTDELIEGEARPVL